MAKDLSLSLPDGDFVMNVNHPLAKRGLRLTVDYRGGAYHICVARIDTDGRELDEQTHEYYDHLLGVGGKNR
ncbi:MAG: hypothetical protein KKB21_03115 [Nanoarchaeota archaeon]|nr:hypothetical protein [Nanoarchaeota archaeon]MBU4086542.1 hypothetical protein [Nanoarchaeota archaeon]